MFFTLEDPNAKIKGSRDPLGAQPIWTAFGRHVVTNLTTQTNSTRGFTILLLGRYLAEQAIEDGRIGRELALDAFLRFEQIGAYVRHAAHGVGGEIRGIERVRSRLREHRGLVPIAADPDGYILGDQRVNGLWGLFSVSARVSGLIPDGPVGLTPEANEFVELQYLPALQPAMGRLSRLVARGGKLDTRAPDGVFGALSRVLSESFTGEEQHFYGQYLRDGLHVRNAPPGRQQRFRELLDHVDLATPSGRSGVVRLYELARPVDRELAYRLDRIVRTEAVLAPAMTLFDFMLTCHNRQLGDMAKELTERWDTPMPGVDAENNHDLLGEVGLVWSEVVRGCFDRCQQGLAGGNYRESLRALLEWHEHVMHSRGGASWVRAATDGTLDVRYRGEEQELPSRDELAELWRNGYFIDSLKAITRQLGEAA